MALRHREFALVTGAPSANYTGSDLVNDGYTGVLVFLNINTIAAGNITVDIEGKSPVGTNEYYTILTSAAITATGLTVLSIHPAILAAANLAAQAPIPATWRIRATIGGAAGAKDFDIGYVYIP